MDLHVLMQAVPVGGYISIYKLVIVLVFSVGWWRLLTWIDKDAPAARLPRELINSGMVGAYVLALIVLLALPSFWAGFPVFIVILLGSVGAYLGIRNARVGLNDLVGELGTIKLLPRRTAAADSAAEEVPGLVNIGSRDGRPWRQPSLESPDRPIYDIIQLMLTEPLRRGMEKLELVPVEGAMLAQYWVDGVAYSGGQFNRQGAANAITALKRLAGMDINEKRKPQMGAIQAGIEGARHELQVHTAGSTAGESLRVTVDARGRHTQKLEQLGLAQQQLEQIESQVAESGGVVLLAAPRGHGLTSLSYAVIRRHDAFMTHIHSIERDPDDDLEGITQNKLPRSATPNDELEKVQWVISQEPDALLMPAVANAKSVRELVSFAASGKRVYIGLRSGTAVDALNDFRSLVGDDELATRHLRMIVACRLVRKLCPACKQPYQPDPETLRKLNLDHAKNTQFYQARTQPMTDQKGNPIACTFCQDLRYHGRTGVYEVMQINDEVRQSVLANASANQLRALVRKVRGRFLQEYALDLVEKGETSIQEVLRAMRGQEQDTRSGTRAGVSPGATGTGTGTSSGTQSASGTFSASGTHMNANQGSRTGRPPQRPAK